MTMKVVKNQIMQWRQSVDVFH